MKISYIIFVKFLINSCVLNAQELILKQQKYKLLKIDSTTISTYYLIYLKNKNKKIIVISDRYKRDSSIKNFELLKRGGKYKLKLSCVSSINLNGFVIATYNDIFMINGKIILRQDECFYGTDQLLGIRLMK